MKNIFKSKKFILGIIFCLMLILNILVPLICDDYFYSYIFRTDNRVKNLFDIIHSEYLHYFNWGGRVLAHSLAQVFLMMPKFVFNVCNSLVYVLEVYLIYLIAKGKRADNYLYLLVIHILLWFFNCSYGEVNFWLVGSCNYLWTTTIVLGFFYQYIRSENENNKSRIFLNAFLGLLAGMCNENMSFALIVMVIFSIIFMKKRGTADIVGLVFTVVGYLFLILAPGNFARLAMNDGGISLKVVLSRSLLLIKSFSLVLLPLIIVLVIYFKKNSFKRELLIYLSGIVICAGWMIVTSDFSLRTLTGCFVFLTIITTYMLFDFKWTSKYIIFIIIPFVISYIFTFKEMISLKTYWKGFEKEVELTKSKKITTVTYPKFTSYNSHVPGSYDLTLIECDYKTDMNYYLSLYYGVERVIGRGDDCE